jgi:hypothetical protein
MSTCIGILAVPVMQSLHASSFLLGPLAGIGLRWSYSQDTLPPCEVNTLADLDAN